jgi:hypothetical protein
MMESMGWKDGDGLGKDRQGVKYALKPTKKLDSSGVGAQRVDSKWLDACCAYDSILAKLNIAYTTQETQDDSDEDSKKKRKREEKEQRRKEKKEKKAKRETVDEEEESVGQLEVDEQTRKREKKAKKEKKEKKAKKAKKQEEEIVEDSTKEEEESEAEPIHVPVARHLIYAKRLKSKHVDGYSENHKAEIFASIQREVKQHQKAVAVPYQPQRSPHGLLNSEDELPVSEEEEEVFDEESEEVENGSGSQSNKISYDGGFTEDTQVDIYNQAMDHQVKGRIGLGVAKKLSKSKRRDHAQNIAQLMKTGSYLSRKFVFAGFLSDVPTKSARSL